MTERHYTAAQDYPPDGLWHLEISEGDYKVSADCEPRLKVSTRDYLERQLDDQISPPAEPPLGVTIEDSTQ